MIIAIDAGTTSTRALLIDKQGKILLTKQEAINQVYPQPGWVEHDPLEIWQKTQKAIRELVSECRSTQRETIEGMAITNQRETTIIWDKTTGKPIYNAIVWQCRRTSEICQKLKKDRGFAKHVGKHTGLLIDSYFSATKIHWLLKNYGEGFNVDNLLFGTVDTWLIWNLTQGKMHATDVSNASRTMMFDIYKNTWDKKILKKLNIPETLLPKVLDSQADFGSSDIIKDLTGQNLSILAVLGDQQAALYAYNNQAKITYGTGTFVLIPGLDKNFNNKSGLVQSIAYKRNQEEHYAIEGSIFIGGSLVQWLRDQLNLINSSAEIEKLALDDNGGVYIIPAFTGLGAPHWKQEVRAAIFGLTRGANKGHLARAALEAITFQVQDIFEVLPKKLLDSITQINVDGGASKNDLLMQIQADVLQKPIVRYQESEMTALGLAKMTGKIDLKLTVDKVFKPTRNYSQEYKIWRGFLAKLIKDVPS